MTDPVEQQIREQLSRYVRGEVTLREFHRWFMPVSWEIHRRGDAAAERLVGTIGLSLAELSLGHATEVEIREEFEEIVASPLRPS